MDETAEYFCHLIRRHASAALVAVVATSRGDAFSETGKIPKNSRDMSSVFASHQ